MNNQTTALLVQEGGKLVTQLLMLYPPKQQKSAVTSPEPDISQEIPQESPPVELDTEPKAAGIEAGCLPCSIGHLGTCSGLLNEAMRFAKKDGIASGEVIERVNMCIDELNALERVDLRPEMITDLPKWQKDLANKTLTVSRDTRHKLEGMVSADDLEKTTAVLQSTRNAVGKAWFQHKLENKESGE